MEKSALVTGFDRTVEDGLFWLTDHAAFVFDFLRTVMDGFYLAILWVLMLPPFYVIIAIVALLAWRALGHWFAIGIAIALGLCVSMNLWPETMSTLALVIAATIIALAISLPLGVAAGLLPWLDRLLMPAMDLIQTLPPYIYLLPAIALLGFGPATALLATIIVAMPPAVRLTSLGIRLTPREFIELGQATGAGRLQTFFKIRLPFAMPSIMAGINQSLMMAFGMVVIAGIVGSGGLGETIYKAIRTLDIATSIDAAIAIVILTMMLDRLTQSAGNRGDKKRVKA